MINLQNNLDELSQDLNSVLKNLDEMKNENFDEKISDINSLIFKIEKKRKLLIKNFKIEDLQASCDAANTAVKHIYSKVDSMIEIRKEEQKKIRNELSEIVNKKKLINYQR